MGLRKVYSRINDNVRYFIKPSSSEGFETLNLLKNSLCTGVILCDHNKRIIGYNHLIRQKISTSYYNILNQNIERLIHFCDCEESNEFQAQQKCNCELKTQYNQSVYCECESFQKHPKANRIYLFHHFQFDKEEKELSGNLSKVIDQISSLYPNCVLEIDSYGNLISPSEEWLSYSRLENKETSNLTVSNLFDPITSQKLLFRLQNEATNQECRFFETELRNSINTSLKTELYILPHEQSEEKRLKLFNLSLLQEQKDNILNAISTKKKEAEKLKESFLANVSHEIRTPLNGILGLTHFLLDEDTSAKEQMEFISIIRNNSEKLIEIIDNIVQVARIEAGELNIKKQNFEINSSLEKLFHRFYNQRSKMNKKQIGLQIIQPSYRKNLSIQSDEKCIHQILNILLHNAFKYSNSGKVRFGYNIADLGTVRFFVKDEGIGIRKEIQKQIFERFRQADDSLSRDFGGTGIGLWLAKKMVELLGGRIWVESEPEKGSCFYFTVPLVQLPEEIYCQTSDYMYSEFAVN